MEVHTRLVQEKATERATAAAIEESMAMLAKSHLQLQQQ